MVQVPTLDVVVRSMTHKDATKRRNAISRKGYGTKGYTDTLNFVKDVAALAAPRRLRLGRAGLLSGDERGMLLLVGQRLLTRR